MSHDEDCSANEKLVWGVLDIIWRREGFVLCSQVGAAKQRNNNPLEIQCTQYMYFQLSTHRTAQ